jgi:hypothetical protein
MASDGCCRAGLLAAIKGFPEALTNGFSSSFGRLNTIANYPV